MKKLTLTGDQVTEVVVYALSKEIKTIKKLNKKMDGKFYYKKDLKSLKRTLAYYSNDYA